MHSTHTITVSCKSVVCSLNAATTDHIEYYSKKKHIGDTTGRDGTKYEENEKNDSVQQAPITGHSQQNQNFQSSFIHIQTAESVRKLDTFISFSRFDAFSWRGLY